MAVENDYPRSENGKLIPGRLWDPRYPQPSHTEGVGKCGGCKTVFTVEIDWKWVPAEELGPKIAKNFFGLWQEERRVIKPYTGVLKGKIPCFDTVSCPECGASADAGDFTKEERKQFGETAGLF